jgi:extracellular factor (EF) 3-hydroxypalmitic acid methyl ester biosynthesis protein
LLDLPGTAASRARRSLLATHIAVVAREVDGARILSVACGHALELDLVPAAARRRIAAWIGVDDNEATLSAAARHAVGPRSRPGPVTVRREGLRELMRDTELDGFDLIYAGGLLSYLAERDCRQLTRNLFRRLAPGGRLLLGGAMPGDPGLGFREVFMNWPMQARDRERMLDFARGIARAEIAHEDVVVEPNGCIGLLELVRV